MLVQRLFVSFPWELSCWLGRGCYNLPQAGAGVGGWGALWDAMHTRTGLCSHLGLWHPHHTLLTLGSSDKRTPPSLTSLSPFRGHQTVRKLTQLGANGKGRSRKKKHPTEFLEGPALTAIPSTPPETWMASPIFTVRKKNPINLVNTSWDTEQGQGCLPFP